MLKHLKTLILNVNLEKCKLVGHVIYLCRTTHPTNGVYKQVSNKISRLMLSKCYKLMSDQTMQVLLLNISLIFTNRDLLTLKILQYYSKYK